MIHSKVARQHVNETKPLLVPKQKQPRVLLKMLRGVSFQMKRGAPKTTRMLQGLAVAYSKLVTPYPTLLMNK